MPQWVNALAGCPRDAATRRIFGSSQVPGPLKRKVAGIGTIGIARSSPANSPPTVDVTNGRSGLERFASPANRIRPIWLSYADFAVYAVSLAYPDCVHGFKRKHDF